MRCDVCGNTTEQDEPLCRDCQEGYKECKKCKMNYAICRCFGDRK